MLYFYFYFLLCFGHVWSVGYHVWAGHLGRGASEQAQISLIDLAMEEVKDWSSIEAVCYNLILSGLLKKRSLFYPTLGSLVGIVLLSIW